MKKTLLVTFLSFALAVPALSAEKAKEYIQGKFLPASILVSQEENDFINNLPISLGRSNDKKTKVYICKNYVCDLPIDNINDLMMKL